MIRPHIHAIVASCIAIGVACGCGDDAGARTPPEPAGAESLDDCDDVVSRVREVLGALPSSCAADGDCTCYPGGIDGVTDCGGVSDLPTAARIGVFTQDFSRLRCDGSVSCAPRQCLAACVAGRCVERSMP